MLDNGNGGNGATTIDFALIRLNTSFISSSMTSPFDYDFQSYAGGQPPGPSIGVDGAVCVTKISPWVLYILLWRTLCKKRIEAWSLFRYLVRALDSGGSVVLTDIVAEVSSLDQRPRSSAIELGTLFDVPDTLPGLNSTGMEVVFSNAFFNSRNQLQKDNGGVCPFTHTKLEPQPKTNTCSNQYICALGSPPSSYILTSGSIFFLLLPSFAYPRLSHTFLTRL